MTPQQIRELRGNLSQERFARELGVSQRTVWNWERGETIPSGLFEDALERYNVRKKMQEPQPA